MHRLMNDAAHVGAIVEASDGPKPVAVAGGGGFWQTLAALIRDLCVLGLLSIETFWSSVMMFRTHLLHMRVSALSCAGRVAAAYVSASIHCRDSSCGKGIPHACPQQPISARKFTHIWSATMARGMRTYQSGGRQVAEVAERLLRGG